MLGAARGYLARMLAGQRQGYSRRLIEMNEAMLRYAYTNCRNEIAERQVQVYKPNIESLSVAELNAIENAKFRPPYDSVALLNVFFMRYRDKPRLLALLTGCDVAWRCFGGIWAARYS